MTECERCKGSGEVSEVEMTNEEWIKGLSTKRMANFLSRVTQKCNDCGVDSLGDMDVKCPYNCGFCNKNAVEEWLKQPHTKGDSE